MKKVLSALAALIVASSLFAYNPPTGSEDLNRFSSPELLSGGRSTAGGSLYYVTPSTIVNNPALPALEQRVMIDLGYTALIDNDDLSDKSYGNAVQIGTSMPSRYGVTTLLAQWITAPFYDMNLGHAVDLRGNFSKEITDELLFGASVDLGIVYDEKNDWKAGIDLGFLYNFGQVAFMKDCRVGFAAINIGKPYSGSDLVGMKGDSHDLTDEDLDEASMYPGLATLRFGVASTLFDTGAFKGGFSADLSVPTFQNGIVDLGFQTSYNEIIRLNVAWNANIRELVEGKESVNLPSIGLSFKFAFKSSKLAAGNADWGQSEMTVATAWQQLYGGNVQAVSGGALLKLGTYDDQPPEIDLWADDSKSEKK